MTASEQHVFLRFMKKHKAWNKFKKEYYKEFDEPLSFHLKTLQRDEVIPCAFPFDRTHQGFTYWHSLDDKFQKLR